MFASTQHAAALSYDAFSSPGTARIRVISLTNRTFDLRAEAAMDEMAAGVWRLTAR
jgi:hypothetical protein